MLILLTSILFIAVIGSVFLYVNQKVRQNYAFWLDRGIPHDTPKFFMGNLIGLGKTRSLTEIVREYYIKYQNCGLPYVGFFVFFRPTAFIIDLDLVKNILVKDFQYFCERDLYYNEKDDPLSANLLNLEGIKWKALRHKLTPTFTAGKIKFMFPTIVSVSEELCETLASEISEDEIVDVKDLVSRYTVDVIGKCAFGIECNSLKDPQVEFRQHIKKFTKQMQKDSVTRVLALNYPTVARKLGITLTPKHIQDFFMNTVKDTVEYRENNNVERKDFMNLLIALKNNGDKDVGNLTLTEVASQAFIFFLAGFDTSSTTISFCLYELALNEDIQNKTREEIVTVLRKHNGEITYDCLNEMVYLEQVVNETLRKHSVTPILPRLCVEDYKVPGHDLVLESGTRIYIPMEGIHHNSDIYPNPDKFDPDRFTKENMYARHPAAFLPFGEGPRNCIGKRFGMMQTKIAILSLLRDFTFQICSKTPIPIKLDPMIMLTMSSGGIYLKINKLIY